jgi:hypothetical protein
MIITYEPYGPSVNANFIISCIHPFLSLMNCTAFCTFFLLLAYISALIVFFLLLAYISALIVYTDGWLQFKGMANEAEMMCLWMHINNKLVDFYVDPLPNEIWEQRQSHH